MKNNAPPRRASGPRAVLWGALLSMTLLAAGCFSSGAGRPPANFRPVADVDTAEVKSAIREVLEAQAEAWNAGDLEGFMQGYARTDSLRFASGGSVRYGWQTTLDNYRRSYPDRAAMGTLTFSDLDIRVLSPTDALVFGRWRLDRASDAPGGLFTLLMKKRETEGGLAWRVVHDHTSAARSE